MKVKVCLFGVSAVLLLLTTVGCNNQYESNKAVIKSATAKTGYRTEIKWIGHWLKEGQREKLVREVAAEYEFLHQDIKVSLVFPEEVYKSSETEQDFIAEQIKKPVADYDIIRIYTGYDMIGQKLNDPKWFEHDLVDFSEIPGFMEGHQKILESSVYKSRFNGHYFSPYNEGQFPALFVNTEVAKKMGIEVKQFGMTYTDFLGYLKAAHEYNKTHRYIIPVLEYDWMKSDLIFKSLYYSLLNGYNEVTNTALTPSKLNALEKTLKAYEEMSAYEPIEPNYQSFRWQECRDYPLKDSCLFFPNFSFMYNIWKDIDETAMRKVVPCELPVFQTSTVYMGGYLSNWAVLKNAPHREEAIKLLMYWCRPDIAELWTRYTKCPSGVKGNTTAVSLGKDNYENYIYNIETKYGSNMVQDMDMQYILGSRNINSTIPFIKVLTGAESAKEAFALFRSRARVGN